LMVKTSDWTIANNFGLLNMVSIPSIASAIIGLLFTFIVSNKAHV
jgi:hypothetical protein